jgi:tRNA-2-methylthio-N6-dimethylallyladenosine synthase
MKYHIKTFGCQMNVSDSERIAGFLESFKITPTKDINKAQLIIFNTCGVRQMAEDRVYGLIHNARKTNHQAKIILTGCLAARKDVQKKLSGKVDLFSDIKNFFSDIPQLLFTNHELSPKSCLPSQYLKIQPKYANDKKAFVPIMTGCDNFCSYCVVPYARGRETSRPIEEIFSEIENLSKNGCEEITLLGQNVNSYIHVSRNLKSAIEKNKKTSFPVLISSLAQSFPGITFKFLTSHPKDFSEELMKVIAKSKNISREIHLPIQSGSDKILRAMNRPYTKKHYLSLIEKAKKIIPDVSFTTDVIVGFPGETEKDFRDTVKVFEKVNYNEAYVNKYSPRPVTAAFSLGDPISWEEKKIREKILRNLIKT